MDSLVGATLGKYHITEMLGHGGMAQVYKAYHRILDRTVAIKVMKHELAVQQGFVESFEHEAMAVARLRHPNIVQVYDFDIANEMPYMVMEFVAGPTLTSELRGRKEREVPYTLDEIVLLFDALAGAVSYAHSRGIIHRDLKPDNTMFTSEGQVVLTDFGLARLVSGARAELDGLIVGTPAYMSPEQAQGKDVEERSDIYTLGIILYELLTGSRPFTGNTPVEVIRQHITTPLPQPTIINPAVPETMDPVILKATRKDPAERYQTATEMARAFRQAVGFSDDYDLSLTVVPTVASFAACRGGNGAEGPRVTVRLEVPACPYRGLFAFREEDAPFFFGREQVTDWLVDSVESRRSVAMVGPSGSGKSSVVLAGLMPHLRQAAHLRQAQGTAWIMSDMRPAGRPFQSLAAAWLPLLKNEGQAIEATPDDDTRAMAGGTGTGNSSLVAPDKTTRVVQETVLSRAVGEQVPHLTQALEQGTVSIAGLAACILEKHPSANRLLLVLDQFEELYTLCSSAAMQQQFLDQLLEGMTSPSDGGPPVLTVVLTLRADFVGQAVSYRPVADLLQSHAYILGPMNHDELAQAIVNPARKVGVAFEVGLVERILNDVGHEPGNLPLLEFALSLMWEEQDEGRLTHQAYEAIGQVEGALARYADGIFNDMDDEQRVVMRRIFVQLVRPGEGTEDTRRVADIDEIGRGDWPLVRKLADSRLVVTGRDADGKETVEVVHEALLRRWERLRAWMREDRIFRGWQERLRSALHQWEASGKDDGGLLRGAPLAEAEGWLQEREEQIGDYEREYIRASIALREQEIVARERQRQRIMRGSIAAGIVLVILLIITGIQWQDAERAQALAAQQRDQVIQANATAIAERDRADTQMHEAERQARLARSGQMANWSLLNLESQPLLSLLLTVEAVSDTFKVDGTRIAAAEDALHQALSIIGGRPMAGNVADVEHSPDGRWLAALTHDSTIHLWDMTNPTEISQTISSTLDLQTTLALSPDGGRIAAVAQDGRVVLWDGANPNGTPTILGGSADDPMPDIAFSADGRWLADATGEGLVLWDVNEPSAEPVTVRGGEFHIFGLAFSPQGRWLSVIGSDMTEPPGHRRDVVHSDSDVVVWRWDMRDLVAGPVVLSGEWGPLNEVVFSPDEEWLVVTSADASAYVWRNAAPEQGPVVLDAHERNLYTAAFSPDSRWLATGSEDTTLRLWDMRDLSAEPVVLEGHMLAVEDVAFSQDGRWLATASDDNTALLWDRRDLAAEPVVLHGHDLGIDTVLFGPEAAWVVTYSHDDTVRLWDRSDPSSDEPRILRGHSAPLMDAAFGPDGAWLATVGKDGAVRLWDRLNPEAEAIALGGHEGAITAVSFSSDGHWLASRGEDGTARLWDMGYLAGEPRVLGGDGITVTAVAFSPAAPDGQWVATADMSGTARLWQVDDPQAAPVVLEGHEGIVTDVAFSGDGQWVATAGRDATARVWRMDDLGGEPVVLRGHEGLITRIAFSPDTRWFATASQDETVRLWEMGDLLQGPIVLSGHEEEVNQVEFSPDSRYLATASADKTARLWDVTGSLSDSVVLRGHEDWVLDMAFHPSGTRLATASWDNTARLWDVTSRSASHVILRGHEQMVMAVEFSPDGDTLVTASSDGTARLWGVDINHLLDLACDMLAHNLSRDEWELYMEDIAYRKTCPSLPVYSSSQGAAVRGGM